MNRRPTTRPFHWLGAFLLFLTGCSSQPPQVPGATGTPEMREALFDSILAMTARRTAFSVPKQEALDFHPLEEMEKLRSEVVEADSEDHLFYALLRLSNARRDRHLSVGLVESGLRPSFTDGLEVWSGPEVSEALEASVRFRPDFTSGGFFVADLATGGEAGAGADASNARSGTGSRAENGLKLDGLAIGDRVVSLNGVPSEDLQGLLSPYSRYSSIPGLRWKIAEALSLKTALLPPAFIGDALDLVVAKSDGTRITSSICLLYTSDAADDRT